MLVPVANKTERAHANRCYFKPSQIADPLLHVTEVFRLNNVKASTRHFQNGPEAISGRKASRLDLADTTRTKHFAQARHARVTK